MKVCFGIFLTFLAIFAHVIVCEEEQENYAHDEGEKGIAKAVIESCPGCSLNRLTEVKSFIFDDVPKYENVEFKRIYGHKPELVLFNSEDEEVERIPLSELSRVQCNELLNEKGFRLKPNTKLEL